MASTDGKTWDYRGRCPTPDKRLFHDKKAAKDWRDRNQKRFDDHPLKPYKCMCGCWHLTSMPKWKAIIVKRIMPLPQIKNEELFKRFLKKKP